MITKQQLGNTLWDMAAEVRDLVKLHAPPFFIVLSGGTI